MDCTNENAIIGDETKFNDNVLEQYCEALLSQNKTGKFALVERIVKQISNFSLFGYNKILNLFKVTSSFVALEDNFCQINEKQRIDLEKIYSMVPIRDLSEIEAVLEGQKPEALLYRHLSKQILMCLLYSKDFNRLNKEHSEVVQLIMDDSHIGRMYKSLYGGESIDQKQHECHKLLSFVMDGTFDQLSASSLEKLQKIYWNNGKSIQQLKPKLQAFIKDLAAKDKFNGLPTTTILQLISIDHELATVPVLMRYANAKKSILEKFQIQFCLGCQLCITKSESDFREYATTALQNPLLHVVVALFQRFYSTIEITGRLCPVVEIPALYETCQITKSINFTIDSKFEKEELQQIYEKLGLKATQIPLCFAQFWVQCAQMEEKAAKQSMYCMFRFMLNCRFDPMYSKLVFCPFQHFDETMRNLEDTADAYQLYLQQGISVLGDPKHISFKDLLRLTQLLGDEVPLVTKQITPVEKFKNGLRLSEDDLDSVQSQILATSLNTFSLMQLLTCMDMPMKYLMLIETVYKKNTIANVIKSHGVAAEFATFQRYCTWDGRDGIRREGAQIGQTYFTETVSFEQAVSDFCQYGQGDLSSFVYDEASAMIVLKQIWEELCNCSVHAEQVIQHYEALTNEIDTVQKPLKLVKQILFSEIQTDQPFYQMISVKQEQIRKKQLSQTNVLQIISYFGTFDFKCKYLAQQVEANIIQINRNHNIECDDEALRFCYVNKEYFGEPLLVLSVIKSLTNVKSIFIDENLIDSVQHYYWLLDDDPLKQHFISEYEDYDPILEFAANLDRKKQNVVAWALNKLSDKEAHKIQKVVSLWNSVEQMNAIKVLCAHNYYQAAFKIAMLCENTCMSEIDSNVTRFLFPQISMQQDIFQDYQQKYDQNLYRTSNPQQNEIRRVLCGVIENPIPSYISWRWCSNKNQSKLSNVFDDFMLDAQSNDLLNALQHNLLHFYLVDITTAMFCAACIRSTSFSHSMQKHDQIILAKRLCNRLDHHYSEIVWSSISLFSDNANQQMYETKISLLQKKYKDQLVQCTQFIRECENLMKQYTIKAISNQIVAQQSQKEENLFVQMPVVDCKQQCTTEQKIMGNLGLLRQNFDEDMTKLQQQFMKLQLEITDDELVQILCKIIKFDENNQNNYIFEQLLDSRLIKVLTLQCVDEIVKIIVNDPKIIKYPLIQDILLQISKNRYDIFTKLISSGHKWQPTSNNELESRMKSFMSAFQEYMMQIINLLKGNSIIICDIQHPIYCERIIKAIRLIKVPHSKNLVAIYEYDYIEQNNENNMKTTKELIKFSDEEFNQLQIINRIVSAMNRNMNINQNTMSDATITKIENFPLAIISKQYGIYAKIQEAYVYHQRHVTDQFNVQIMEFIDFIPIFDILLQKQDTIMDELAAKAPNVRSSYKSCMEAIYKQIQKFPDAYQPISQALSGNYLLWYLLDQCDPYKAVSAFQRSFVVNTLLTGAFGINDRHLQNVTLISNSNKVLNIDVESCFFKGLTGTVPELVPFRFTKIFRKCFCSVDQFKNLLVTAHKICFADTVEIMTDVELIIKNELLRGYIRELLESSDKFSSLTKQAIDDVLLAGAYCGWMACL